ncbi:Spindle-pole body protein (Pcp1) [Trichuris trichiura]|uniref:Spindle-pole body protein (Pcp1) n=1 Tax=Trichuris trichiura TaxID=36087 RepID=A0A077Z6T4_TRITR|nr:Spindle-pole body protein (Pcp1) [Trichuris trichiura]
MNDENSTDSQSIGDLLSPSFDLNAAYRPRNLERTVEAFKRENFSLRVEVYYLKTRLHEAGITFRSPDPEQYKLDAVIFKQKLEEKEKQLSSDEMQLAKIGLAEDIRHLRNQLERAHDKNKILDSFRLKCEELEEANKEMVTALSQANRDNVLLKDALAVMNEFAPESNENLINEKDKEISKLKSELLRMEALLKMWQNPTDAVQQRETAISTSMNGCQDGQASVNAIANGQASSLSQDFNKVQKDELPASIVASTSSSSRRLPTKDNVEAPQQVCVKCENYERALAAIGRSIPGQWSRYEDENAQRFVLSDRLAIRWLLKHLSSLEEKDEMRLKFSSLYKINSRLRRRAQQSSLMLTKVTPNVSASSELKKLSTFYDSMLDDLGRIHSLVRELEVRLPSDINFAADEFREQELTTGSKEPSDDGSKSPSSYGSSTGASAANAEKLKETIGKSKETRSNSLADRPREDCATQTANIHCSDVGVQCQRAFDIEKFYWSKPMLTNFPWLKKLTFNCFTFLDSVVDVLQSNFTEDEKEPFILASCDLFRENVLPIFHSLAAEKLPVSPTIKANEEEQNVALSEREQAAESYAEGKISSVSNVNSSEETSHHQVQPKSPTAAVAFDLRYGSQMVFNLHSQIKYALHLLRAIQQSQNGSSLKRRLNIVLPCLQLAVDFAEALLLNMNKVRLANDNARVNDGKLGWILHNLNRALANVRNDSVLMGSRLRRTDGSVTMLVHENYELRAELNRCKGDLKNKQLQLVGNSKYVHRQTCGQVFVADQIENGYHGSSRRAGKVKHHKL